MVYPNITPQSLVEAASSDAANPPVPRPPRVEYLATLSRHSAPVNVVRFSPNGAPAFPRNYTRRYPVLTALVHRRIDRVGRRWCAPLFLSSSTSLCLTTTVTDGMVIIWAQSNSPTQPTYGSDLSGDDLQFEKEHWKPRTTFRYARF